MLGRAPASRPAVLPGHELGIQREADLPRDIRALLGGIFGEDSFAHFREYGVTHAAVERVVHGRVWQLRPTEMSLVDAWLLHREGWFVPRAVHTYGGGPALASVLRADIQPSEAVDGRAHTLYPGSTPDFIRHEAHNLRRAERQKLRKPVGVVTSHRM